MKQHYDIYVDDRYIETLYSGWPMMRIMRQLQRKYPDAINIEIRKRSGDNSLHYIPALIRS